MARAQVKLNSPGMSSLLKDAGVRKDLTARMERAEAVAVATAPFKTGAYKASIHLVQDTTDRAVVRLVASAPHSHLVQARTGHLAKALDAAGGD